MPIRLINPLTKSLSSIKGLVNHFEEVSSRPGTPRSCVHDSSSATDERIERLNTKHDEGLSLTIPTASDLSQQPLQTEIHPVCGICTVHKIENGLVNLTFFLPAGRYQPPFSFT